MLDDGMMRKMNALNLQAGIYCFFILKTMSTQAKKKLNTKANNSNP